jgi:hypothetical protein
VHLFFLPLLISVKAGGCRFLYFEQYHHRFILYDIENKVEFTDIIEVNTLELRKLPQAEDGSELWDWPFSLPDGWTRQWSCR